ncbi:S-layer homology domain-containing protein [Deinococcus aquaticus]|uniref:S-layer homology domain-containing protein n=1 Tax=Deinococcus aquaticus TaxID=328692 RepID=UPI003F45D5DB
MGVHMKKSLLVLTAALSFGVAAAQTAAPASAPQVPALTDVPAGHWAKDAIDKLVSTGIILGYPDGTFRGTQNLTRYEAAVIIARLLDQVKTGEVNPSTMDPETLTALQNAIQELAADLAALGVRVSDLEENAVSRDDFARLEERVEAIALQNGDPEALAGLTSQIDELTARADDYDTLRADVDDNASSIAALNDLTVLLNQDILNLQDRVSAVEAAQADLVARADYDNLAGRVGVVETKVTSIDNRVTQLEKYAFSIKPSLEATYFVGRATRDMDIDRLLAGTVLGTGDDGDKDTADAPRDYADFSGDNVAIGDGTVASTFYGFSTGAATFREGSTDLDFSIDFGNAGNFDSAKSTVTGAYVKGAGGLNVNKVDVKFGIRAGLPDDAAITPGPDGEYGTADDVLASTVYPDVYSDDEDYTYSPLFFYFRQATADFSIGNTPVVVTFGKSLKFKFADYIGDNDTDGRGDGFNVLIDGSTLPVIGSFKPTIQTVYGSRGGANGDHQYYRGVRATITPVGTLKAGVHVLQEGLDETGAKVLPATAAARNTTIATTSDVTAYGADLHGQVAGWQLDSEYAKSRIQNISFAGGTGAATVGNVKEEDAFYAKTSGSIGQIIKVDTLNYRSVSAGYNAVAGIMEADTDNSDDGSTAPYEAGRTGFGVKLSGTLGPVAIGGYTDNEVAYGKSPLNTATEASAIVDRGVTGKVSLFNLVTVRGGYYEYLVGAAAPSDFKGQQGVRYGVRGDVTPGLGIGIGAYYRDLTINGTKAQNDAGLFAEGKYNSYFALTSNTLTDQSGCGDLHPGIKSTDADGVGRALTFTENSFGDSYCYSEMGVDVTHNGKDANALVKDLSFRLGYASRYRNATTSNSNNFIYGDVLYGKKLGIAQVDVKGAFGIDTYDTSKDAAANSNAFAAGVKVVTDPLNTVFKPSFEGQVGYYSRSYDYGTATTTADYTATGLKYVAGVKLNEFLLPNTKLAVYYAGYEGKNRYYRNVTASTAANGGDTLAGSFRDLNTNATVRQNLVYVEGNYYDLSFGYGYGTLTLRDLNGNAVTGAPDSKGSVFKINYKVTF